MAEKITTANSYTRATLEDRFWNKVKKTSGCWLWTGWKNDSGYGMIWDGVRLPGALAHRLAYELLVGPIPNGMTIDHLCRVRHCVNPKHLEPVTRRENVLRGLGIGAVNARKTHCIWGHIFDEENTYQGCGRRYCRKCSANRDRKRRAERKVKWQR